LPFFKIETHGHRAAASTTQDPDMTFAASLTSSSARAIAVSSLALWSLLPLTPAHAEDARVLCDRSAASSYDETRPAGIAGVNQDAIVVKQALDACRAAYEANKGDARLAFQLGRVLARDGKGAEAIALYQAAAKAGHATAMVNLGAEVEPKQPAEAFALYKQAAEKGHVLGMFNLGVAYRDGVGVTADAGQALAWLHKAASMGDGWAAYNIGVMQDEGKLIPADKAQAIAHYKLAAGRGIVDAMINLAVMSEKGDGMPVDTKAALVYYKQAAALGDKDGIAGAARLEAVKP
jgi:uncharacterized protein